MSAHAPLAPSSAARWIACPGSVQAERAIPKPPPSSFAEAGTAAHEVFARCLLCGLRPTDPALALALDLTRGILNGRPFMVELRLPALPGLPHLWGTSDLVAFAIAGPLEVVLDLKFGEALCVEPDEVQLGIYTLLAARRFGVADGVDVWVVQPRHDHPAGPARRHHYALRDLDQLEADIRQAAAVTEAPDAPRRAGPWCRFCAAAPVCPARQRAPSAVPGMPSAWFRPVPRWFAR